MTPEAMEFLDLLYAFKPSGQGPDCNQLIGLWQPRDPEGLRPVLDELKQHGRLKFNSGWGEPNAQRSRYGLHGIAGITLT